MHTFVKEFYLYVFNILVNWEIILWNCLSHSTNISVYWHTLYICMAKQSTSICILAYIVCLLRHEYEMVARTKYLKQQACTNLFAKTSSLLNPNLHQRLRNHQPYHRFHKLLLPIQFGLIHSTNFYWKPSFWRS